MTTTISGKNKDELDRFTLNIMANSIEELLRNQDQVVIAIPGGRSIQGVFKLLGEDGIPWERVHIFMVDERLVSLNQQDSNFKLGKEMFLDKLVAKGVLPEENIHPFVLDRDIDDFGILHYEQELKRYGGIYDIVLLSAGEDGHIGALYPNHHSIKSEAEFYLTMNDSPKPPKARMTLSRKLLLKSKVTILLFFDRTKKEAYRKFRDNQVHYESCPAKLALLVEGSYVITDLG